MSSILSPGIDEGGARSREPAGTAGHLLASVRRIAIPTWAFLGTGLLAAVLYVWNLAASGYANAYYAAAALAASQSWTAWFFGSLDAGNFITVDKPPLATMLMGLSVRVFGLSSWSILLPQALLGVASVLLLFRIVQRQFGPLAATVSAIVMALTPVAVLMFRYDHPDALLVFLMLAGAYSAQRAIEDGRHRWLVVAGVAVGLAFLTKYLQGFLVAPAIVLVYLVAARASIRRRLAGLAIFGATTFTTAAAWVAAVELTPASLRPFIGGSTNNSVLDLIFGYDGLGRIFGASGAGVGGQGGANFSGTPGILRLFNVEFGGQISWLLPFAILSLAIGLIVTLRSRRTDRARAGYLLWGAWLAVHAVVFSFMSGIVHSYYAVAMAPAIGALVGAGFVALWQVRRRFRFGGLPLAAGIAATAAWASILLGRSPQFLPWLAPAVVAVGLGVAAALALPFLRGHRLAPALGGLALAAMLAGPTSFAVVTAASAYSGSIVSAGPATSAGEGFGGGPGGNAAAFQGRMPMTNAGFGRQGTPPSGGLSGSAGAGLSGPGAGGPGQAGSADAALVDYLLANRGDATWIVAVSTSSQAAEIELASGASVMAMGGWSGSDDALTVAQLQADVAAGKLRYVLLSGGNGGFGGPNGGSTAVSTWVTAHGKAVTVAGSAGTYTLYDLSATATA